MWSLFRCSSPWFFLPSPLSTRDFTSPSSCPLLLWALLLHARCCFSSQHRLLMCCMLSRGWSEREPCQQPERQCCPSIWCRVYAHWLSGCAESSRATSAWYDSISEGSKRTPRPSIPWFRKASHSRHGLSSLLAKGNLIPLLAIQQDALSLVHLQTQGRWCRGSDLLYLFLGCLPKYVIFGSWLRTSVCMHSPPAQGWNISPCFGVLWQFLYPNWDTSLLTCCIFAYFWLWLSSLENIFKVFTCSLQPLRLHCWNRLLLN